MKIIVCIKPLATGGVGRDDILRSGTIHGRTHVMNPPDRYAIEEARRISRSYPGSSVCAVLLGPAGAQDVLRDALAAGADTAVHLVSAEDVHTAREAASVLADYIRAAGFDLVITGIAGEDTADGSMGPMLAAFLDVPFAWGVMSVECPPSGERLVVDCEIEGGDRLSGELTLPALVSVGTGINRPPYPSLTARMRSMEAGILSVEAGHPSAMIYELTESVEPLPANRNGIFINGTTGEKAAALLQHLRHRNLL